jgi:hypothetical protein
MNHAVSRSKVLFSDECAIYRSARDRNVVFWSKENPNYDGGSDRRVEKTGYSSIFVRVLNSRMLRLMMREKKMRNEFYLVDLFGKNSFGRIRRR